jgi:hypothetical protein
MKLLFKSLCDIKYLAGFTPAPVGQSEELAAINNSAEESHENYCKFLRGKALLSAKDRAYSVALNELKAVLKSKTSDRTTKNAE